MQKTLFKMVTKTYPSHCMGEKEEWGVSGYCEKK